MALPPTHVFGLAADLLELAVGAIEDPPARRFVADGFVVYDCDLVAVEVIRLRLGLPQQTAPNPVVDACANKPTAEVVIHIVRCVPSLGPEEDGSGPAAEAISSSGVQILSDAWQIWRALRSDLPELPSFHDRQFLLDEAHPIEQQGGLGGTLARLHIELG